MSESRLPTVAFIGVGTMMEAMVDKAIEGGWPRSKLLLTHRRAERRQELADRFSTQVDEDNLAAVRAADMVVLGVRPQEMDELIETLKPAFNAKQTLLSIAAGLTVDWLKERIPAGMTVVRVTPPPTAWISAGATLLSGGEGLGEAEKEQIHRLVKATCERTQWIPDELMEPVTGVALAFTPYICFLIQTLTDVGVEQGGERCFIREMIMEGMYATARLMHDGKLTPEQVIEMVATREGLTWSALHTLEAYGAKSAFRMAARSLTGRSFELRGERVPNEYIGFHR